MKSGRCEFLSSWSEWDIAVHEDEAQIARQERAAVYQAEDFEIDEEEKTACFGISSDFPYKTTLQGCTCPDFRFRRLPCKHMYRLAEELDNIKIDGFESHEKENRQKNPNACQKKYKTGAEQKTTFAVTGKLMKFTRKEITEKIEAAGGRVTTTVSSMTDYLVVGAKPGSKVDSAVKLGVTLIGEDDLPELLKAL